MFPSSTTTMCRIEIQFLLSMTVTSYRNKFPSSIIVIGNEKDFSATRYGWSTNSCGSNFIPCIISWQLADCHLWFIRHSVAFVFFFTWSYVFPFYADDKAINCSKSTEISKRRAFPRCLQIWQKRCFKMSRGKFSAILLTALRFNHLIIIPFPSRWLKWRFLPQRRGIPKMTERLVRLKNRGVLQAGNRKITGTLATNCK